MLDFLPPEMLRRRLEELILQIKLLRLGAVRPFLSEALDPPESAAITRSLCFLIEVGALDEAEELTPLGRHLARLPVAPQCGKMILLGALFSCLDPVVTVAASLGYKDAFYSTLEEQNLADSRRQELSRDCQSDHLLLVHAFEGWKEAKRNGGAAGARRFARHYFLAESVLRQLDYMRNQFGRMLHDLRYTVNPSPSHATVNYNAKNMELVRAVICAGLYPHIVQADCKWSRKKQCYSRPRLRTRPQDPAVEIFPQKC